MLHNLITAIRSNSLYLFYLANRTIKVNCSNYYSHRAKFSENKSVLSWHSIIVTFTSDDLLQYSSLKSSYNFQDIHVSKGVEIRHSLASMSHYSTSILKQICMPATPSPNHKQQSYCTTSLHKYSNL